MLTTAQQEALAQDPLAVASTDADHALFRADARTVAHGPIEGESLSQRLARQPRFSFTLVVPYALWTVWRLIWMPMR
jgi:hypothetical protein